MYKFNAIALKIPKGLCVHVRACMYMCVCKYGDSKIHVEEQRAKNSIDTV